MYAVMKDGKVIDAVEVLSYCRYAARSEMVLRCTENDQPEGIISERTGVCYHVDGWPRFPDVIADSVDTVELMEIDETTFKALVEALDNGEPAPSIQPDEVPENPSVEWLKADKIYKLSKACNESIVAGFFCTISDGATHHFGWTLEDQANFTSRMIQLMSGMVQTCDYYDYDGTCLILTASDMQIIAGTADANTSYFRAYYHCLVMMVNAMEDVESVRDVEWGVSVPDQYQSEAFQKYASLIGGEVYEPSETD